MANSLCFFSSPPTFCQQSHTKTTSLVQKRQQVFQTSKSKTFEIQATNNPPPATKVSSIVCQNCEGNGAVACSHCKGGGVNLIDHFNGQFKAGGLCWLCRGKKEVLCGECNGAGFLGGFLSTFDE
ncbi:unnamed protein product [Cochlearia groenlandica]